MKNIYLAGPMTGVTFDVMKTWRHEFIQKLHRLTTVPHIIEFYSPLRDLNEKMDKGDLSWTDASILGCPSGITSRDYNDVKTADLVVANFLGSTRASLGTAMELAWAWQNKTPTIVIVEDKNVHDHPMIIGVTGFRCRTLDEGVFVARSVLNL